jgi:hypothetical protein
MELCEQAAIEQDSKKLMAVVTGITRLIRRKTGTNRNAESFKVAAPTRLAQKDGPLFSATTEPYLSR